MLITTRAIIFRATKYQESSLILDAYTELKGLRKYIISGVRKAKARTPASLLQVMN
ncbi:MAG: recombination protein O N-terminal domain-containing protein, partial [Bacteroidota bacterium]